MSNEKFVGRAFTADSMKPSQGRRPWVKLWVNDWLEGTTRYQMTDAQRAFWIDLLAMAGRSRFGGVVCAGKDGDVWIGYPLSKFQGLLAEPIDIEATFELFERTGKIKLEVSADGRRKLYTLWILNWAHYQSEYERKRAERAKRRESVPSNVPSDVPKTSGEVSHSMSPKCTSTEERRKKEKKEGEAEDSAAAVAFASFHCEPFGDKRFQAIWIEEWKNPAGNYADTMERAVQRCKSLGITVPGRFYRHKREIERVEAETAYRKTPL